MKQHGDMPQWPAEVLIYFRVNAVMYVTRKVRSLNINDTKLHIYFLPVLVSTVINHFSTESNQNSERIDQNLVSLRFNNLQYNSCIQYGGPRDRVSYSSEFCYYQCLFLYYINF